LRAELAAEESKTGHFAGSVRGAGAASSARIADLRGRLADLSRLDGCLDFAGGHGAGPAFLLSFAPDGGHAEGGRGQGRAVVALGDPDRAAHTAVFVPGMGVGAGAVRDELARVGDLRAAADAKTPAADVAAVVWIGYDAPDKLDQALDPRYAERAAPALGRFTAGLRAAHSGSPDHLTVVGHSYGSLVVGEAAQTGQGLHADDIIAVGSPGMHASHASQLGTAPGHVWIGSARDDPVPGLGALAYAVPVTGTTPEDPEFGANRFTTDGISGHSGYWSTEHPDSLDNQAAVVAGKYGEVRLVSGTLPQPAPSPPVATPPQP
jgi:hypothetical protein